jgi:hypothetical protein
MNRFGIILFSLPFCFVVNATEVNKDVQKRAVVLEDFTGIHCGWCPKAHTIMHQLEYYHGDAIMPIAVHSGYYAVPYRGEPDFRTSAGDAVTNFMSLMDEGRPVGVLNREAVDGVFGLSRSVWGTTFKELHAEDAEVNLAAEATYDNDTRKVSIHIDGYSRYTENKNCYLSVAVVQDNIQGPQNGAGVGDEYIHQDILRDYVTDYGGDEITLPATGLFSADYEYTLPERYYAPEDETTGVVVLPHDIRFIIFLTENSYTPVINAINCRPKLLNYPTSAAATIKDPILTPGSRYGYRFFELQLCNRYNEAITTADFTIALNGEEESYQWVGELAPYETKIIHVPYTLEAAEDENNYSVTLNAVNGETIAPTSLSGYFYSPVHASPHVRIQITTDEYADQNSFILYDADGNKVRELGPYEAGVAATYTEEVDLSQNETYCLEIRDYCVDGITKGSYKIYSEDDSLVEQNYSIDTVGAQAFFRTDKESGVGSLSGEVKSVATLYSVSGVKVAECAADNYYEVTAKLQPGIYLLTTVSAGVEKCKKIVIR